MLLCAWGVRAWGRMMFTRAFRGGLRASGSLYNGSAPFSSVLHRSRFMASTSTPTPPNPPMVPILRPAFRFPSVSTMVPRMPDAPPSFISATTWRAWLACSFSGRSLASCMCSDDDNADDDGAGDGGDPEKRNEAETTRTAKEVEALLLRSKMEADAARMMYELHFKELDIGPSKRGADGEASTSNTSSTPRTINDAKLEGVTLVCSWFSETAFGELIYNSDMDYSAYSAWCCLGHVDLVFVENAGGDFYVFNDPEAVENLQLALELTKADDPGQQRQIEEPAEAAVRRQAVEQGRAAGALAAESLDVREVLRAPGKRFATSAVTRK